MERFRGRADIDLDEVGIEQAELTAKRLSRWPVSAIYSSPLKRALTTAGIISRHVGQPVIHLSGLIDIDYGSWQGLSVEEVRVRDGKRYELWLENPHLVTFPDGESLGDVRDRVTAALDGLSRKHEEQTVVLVSHKVVCKVLLLNLLGMDISQFWRVEQDVSAINVFELRGGFYTVTLLNDTCHLRGLASTPRSVT